MAFAFKAASEHPPITQSLASHEGCFPSRTSWLSSSHGRRHPIPCKTCKDLSVLLWLKPCCEAVSTAALVEYHYLTFLSARDHILHVSLCGVYLSRKYCHWIDAFPEMQPTRLPEHTAHYSDRDRGAFLPSLDSGGKLIAHVTQGRAIPAQL